MRRFLSLFTVLMLCGVFAFAQSRVVSGRVLDNSGKAVPFASIVVKGGKTGVQSDINGDFSIRGNTGDILVISSQSFNSSEIAIPASGNINFTLVQKENTIQEVIVTSAFQTKRTLRSQSSNVQNVSSEQLNTIRQANINNSLAGKVAGAQVRSQSAAALGRETAVRLRGENGIGSGGGAIYVVDGTIIPSSNDINTDDVEDVTVLQGPAAAALFGPDGANGAIVINTKKAKKGQPGLGIEINSGVTFDQIYITPDYQNAYAGGADYDLRKYTWTPGQPLGWKALDGKYYHEYSDDASWGPRMVGQEYIPWDAWYPGHEGSFKTAKLTPQPNNAKDFYSTGVTKTNNVSLSKAGENFNIRVSYTNLDIKGLIPNSFLKRNNFNTNFSVDLSKKLTFTASVNYLQQSGNFENNDGYSNQSTGSFNQWFHRDLDINKLKQLRGLKSPTGIYASWNHANPAAYSDANPLGFYGANYWLNPYTYFDIIKNINNRNRLFGDVSFIYKFNNDFRIKATYRKNQLNTDGYAIYPTEMETSQNQSTFNPYQGTGKAAYGTNSSFSNRQNYEVVASYNKKVRDFAFNFNAGIDILKTTNKSYSQNTMGGLNVPGLYSLPNSKDDIAYNEAISNFTRRGIFIRGDVGWKNMLFLEGSYRRDYASSEPVNSAGIVTKSLGFSFVLSDLIKNKSILSYAKIRASTGSVVNTLAPYQLFNPYFVNQNQFDGNFLMAEPGTLSSSTLSGATNNEKEIGLETRFLKNRIGFSVTYWDRTNKNFPLTVAASGASGYNALTTNAGEIAKTGVDIQFNAKPILSKNFDWDISATWGRLLRNEVVSISEGVTRIVVSSGAFSGSSAAYTVSQVGLPWGQMFGGGIKRNAAGLPILTAAGKYTKQDDVNFGSVLPDYTGGVQNTFTLFKNFTVNINIDYSYGGKFFSLSDHWGTFSGLTAQTAVLNDKGNSIRDLVRDGGGVRVIGVDETGKSIDTYLEAQDYFHQFRSANISEVFIHDLSFVKLREFSLGYKLPVERMGISKYVKSATFSVIARNPWLIYSQTKDFDPSEISNVFGEDGQLPGTRSMGVNLRIGF